jgi:two-component system cell cycle response regulator
VSFPKVNSMKVLVAEDDPVSRRLLEITLSASGYRVVVAADGREALQMLQGPDAPRLVILDWMMPGLDGVEVCRAVKEKGQEPYVYIIILTIKGQQEEIVEGLEAGANDYVTKPFDLQELRARLRAGERILELHDQLVLVSEKLRFQTMHDSLTTCLSRSAIFDVLQKEVSRSVRQDSPLAVIMVDLDHFKTTNDTYGHDVGDAVLQKVARRMMGTIRTYDSIGRYGGEEFLIVAPGCDAHAAAELGERLRCCVAAKPIRVASDVIFTTVSLGVAVRSNGLQEWRQLLKAADNFLYSAKKAGRNRVEHGAAQRPLAQSVQSVSGQT